MSQLLFGKGFVFSASKKELLQTNQVCLIHFPIQHASLIYDSLI